MEQEAKELLTARIVAGVLRCKVDGRTILIKKPDLEHIYYAQERYIQYKEELEEAGCMSEAAVIQLMTELGLWDKSKEQSLTDLPKEIENFKVGLYESQFKSNEKKRIRQYLDVAKKTYAENSAKRQTYNYVTATGAAAMLRNRYLIAMSLFALNGTRLFNEENFWESRNDFLDEVISKYFETRASETEIRLLARTEPWRSIWNTRKSEGSVFGLPSVSLNEEQRALSVWSSIYDSVYEHSECPIDDVIEDDDVLDGWMILQRRKRKQQGDKKGIENFTENERIRGSSELFIPVDTMEDAKKLNEYMDPHSLAIKKQRLRFVAKHGEVKEYKMPDTQIEIQGELLKRVGQHARGESHG